MKRKLIYSLTVLVCCFSFTAFAGVFEDIYEKAPERVGGAKEINYDQFMEIRGTYEDYVLIDVRPQSHYLTGHVEGARSFPGETINKETAAAHFSPSSRIITCSRSIGDGAAGYAADRLFILGYKNVLSYKGGTKEWQRKGHVLVR